MIKLYNLIVYNEKDIHFKDFYLKMSKKVLLRKYKINKLKLHFIFINWKNFFVRIDSEYVRNCLEKQWINIFKCNFSN